MGLAGKFIKNKKQTLNIMPLGVIFIAIGAVYIILSVLFLTLCPKTQAYCEDVLRYAKRTVYVYEYKVDGETYSFRINKSRNARAPDDLKTVRYVKSLPGLNNSHVKIPYGCAFIALGVMCVMAVRKKE